MNTTTVAPILDRLSVLGDETRSRILALLETGEMTVSELCAVLQLPQPNVSRHLKTLASEGWIDVRAEGRSRHYQMSPDLEPAARQLWGIVRTELSGNGVFASDAERAHEVLEERRRRSEAFFAQAAERWDDLRAELFGPGAASAPLLGLLDERWTVGDLGSGTGALAEILAPFVQRVIGVDRSTEMLDAARLRTQGLDHVEFRAGELDALPIDDGELDLAVLGLVLHYVLDPRGVLAEAHRCLEPGGHLIVLDMRAHERDVGRLEEMGHVWPGFESAQLESWLTEAGFERTRIVPLRPDLQASGPPLFLASARRPQHDNHHTA